MVRRHRAEHGWSMRFPLSSRVSFASVLAAVLATSACAHDSDGTEPLAPPSGSTGAVADSDGASEGTDPDSTGSASGSSGEVGPTPVALERAWVESIEGPWLGPVSDTPAGDIPQFFLDFTWQDDGSLHALADDGEGSSFEFRFVEAGDSWTFDETGSLPGGLVQSHTMVPVQVEGNRVRWVSVDAPGVLEVELEVDEQRFQMDVSVLGMSHAAFDLTRPGG